MKSSSSPNAVAQSQQQLDETSGLCDDVISLATGKAKISTFAVSVYVVLGIFLIGTLLTIIALPKVSS
jgi:hypothetical protein